MLIYYPDGRAGDYAIPDGVKYIAGDGYGITSPFRCDGLASIYIPDSMEGICWAPFSRCPNLLEINVSPDNGSFSSQNGVLFSKDHTTILAYPPGRTGAYAIPEGVLDLGDYAFYNCNGLTSLTIPEGVTYLYYTVGDYTHTAFLNCTNLAHVVIPRSVSVIDDEVFDNCSNLTIQGYADSEAQRHAEKKSIPFIEIIS